MIGTYHNHTNKKNFPFQLWKSWFSNVSSYKTYYKDEIQKQMPKIDVSTEGTTKVIGIYKGQRTLDPSN